MIQGLSRVPLLFREARFVTVCMRFSCIFSGIKTGRYLLIFGFSPNLLEKPTGCESVNTLSLSVLNPAISGALSRFSDVNTVLQRIEQIRFVFAFSALRLGLVFLCINVIPHIVCGENGPKLSN